MSRISVAWVLGLLLGSCATPAPAPSNDPELDAWKKLSGVPEDDASKWGGRLLRPVPSEDNARITYTQEAIEQRVEGLMIVKGVVTADGQFTQLKVLKPLPVIADHVVAILSTWRFTPAMVEGRPVAIKFVVPVRLKLPRAPPDAGAG